MIKIENLEKKYPNGNRVLHDINACIEKGEVISVIGPSGCGKSTFIRCLNRLEEMSGGHVWFNDKEITGKKADLHKLRLNVGMVFQEFNLFENMTAVENVMFPQIKALKKNKKEAYKKAMELLKSVGMAERALYYPSQMSGGQKQRVAIARTLSTDPQLILFDEPTSALDPSMVNEVEIVLRKLAKNGTTMIIVTHSMELARSISSRIFYLDEGTLYEEGTPKEIFEHPRRPKTKAFVNKLRITEFNIDSEDYDFVGMLSLMEAFSEQNDISRYARRQLRAVTEEFIIVIMGPELSRTRKIHVMAAYQPVTEQLQLVTEYSGDRFDARELVKIDSIDDRYELSVRIINANISTFEYFYEPGEFFSNRIVMEFRKK